MSSSGGVAIPSSTVVAIGGGFVALALLVLTTLFFVRVFRLRVETSRRRRRGETVTFREVWDREGGVWGFLTGLNADNSMLGPGARSEMMLSRLRQEARLWEYYADQADGEKAVPKMWEMEVDEKGVMLGQEVLDVDDCRPLAVASSRPPDQIESEDAEADYDLLEPKLSLSVLILNPTPSRDYLARRRGSEDWPDLPEMVMGLMSMEPYIYPGSSTAERHGSEPVEDPNEEDDKHLEKGQSSIEGYGDERDEMPVLDRDPGGVRRAGWRKIDKRWAIEGINDIEEAGAASEAEAGGG